MRRLARWWRSATHADRCPCLVAQTLGLRRPLLTWFFTWWCERIACRCGVPWKVHFSTAAFSNLLDPQQTTEATCPEPTCGATYRVTLAVRCDLVEESRAA